MTRFRTLICFVLLIAGFVVTLDAAAQEPAPDRGGNMAWSPDGTRLVVFGTNGIFLYDRAGRLLASRIETIDNYFAFSGWSPDGRYILFGNQVFDGETLQIYRELTNYPRGWIRGSAQVFTLHGDRFEIINVVDGSIAGTIPLDVQLEEVTSSPDGNWIASQVNRTLLIFDVNAGVLAHLVDQGGRYAWSEDGTQLIFASTEATFNILTLNTGMIVTSRENVHTGAISLQWRGGYVAGLGPQGTVTVWDTNTFEVISTVDVGEAITGNLNMSPFGAVVAVGLVPDRREAPPITLDGAAYVAADMGGAVAFVVPDPSPARLQAIAELCGAPSALRSQLDSAIVSEDYAGLIAQVEALPSNTLPPACAADLIAVAEAIQAQ